MKGFGMRDLELNSFKCWKQCKTRFFECWSFVRRAKMCSILLRGQNNHITRLWRRNVCTMLWPSWPTRELWGEGNAIAWLVAQTRRVVPIHLTQKMYRCTTFLLRTMCGKSVRNLSADTANFVPSKTSSLCSVHFENSCFEQRSTVLSGNSEQGLQKFKRFMIKGSVPTRDTVIPYSAPESSHKRRKVSPLLCSFTVLH